MVEENAITKAFEDTGITEALEEMRTADDLFGLRMTRTISLHNLRNIMAVMRLKENPDSRYLQDIVIHLFFSRFAAAMSINPEALLELDLGFGEDMIEMVISYFDDGIDNFKFRKEVVDSYLNNTDTSDGAKEAIVANIRSIIEILDHRIAELS